MSVASPLTALSDQVQTALNEFVAVQRTRMAELGPAVGPLVSAAEQCVADGKRLRAGYCYWGWRAAGGDPDDARIVWAAAALEWLQSSALVHDDIMDASDIRRGRPAMHRAFAQQHRDAAWRGDADRYGVGAAILLGDLLLSWSEDMFRTSRLPPESLARAAPYLDACKTEVVAGQFLDLASSAAGEYSVEVAMTVVRYKAAKYTVERPLHLGAALAGADDALLGMLSAYGLPVGEAFQLRDDVLGVFGDTAVTGKPAGDDLREGKRTVLLARAFENADDEQRAIIDNSVGNGALSTQAVAQLRDVIVATGALACVEQQIEQLHQAALEALETADISDTEAKAALRALAELSVQRQR
ncbi:MAG: polyprenyl synthetase family protein [Nocardioidaceae bacterium]|nr:polyprenyl synthetase family protein [Nocardioidaceae bacterium]